MMRTISTERYYTSMEHLLGVYDRDASDYVKWKKEVRKKLGVITGLHRMESSDLKPELLESRQMEEHRWDGEKTVAFIKQCVAPRTRPD